ncbi:Piso0_005447 [Millerozyma farinosa CBS 7064]|uniref:Piso0_005447 protein n=1 Tax=Pichia sorbitophila (strain ATCC MYA-4447 / BCRC 22081 / CBS 7064 / NBRC 10061 / NRRL Y-12695) TaxID=559304 RepID=G8Y544_PICSO|nr:Piso0_005447 [Millerozyma farinosa CBS 7064]
MSHILDYDSKRMLVNVYMLHYIRSSVSLSEIIDFVLGFTFHENDIDPQQIIVVVDETLFETNANKKKLINPSLSYLRRLDSISIMNVDNISELLNFLHILCSPSPKSGVSETKRGILVIYGLLEKLAKSLLAISDDDGKKFYEKGQHTALFMNYVCHNLYNMSFFNNWKIYLGDPRNNDFEKHIKQSGYDQYLWNLEIPNIEPSSMSYNGLHDTGSFKHAIDRIIVNDAVPLGLVLSKWVITV